jgi:hypothetical protein
MLPLRQHFSVGILIASTSMLAGADLAAQTQLNVRGPFVARAVDVTFPERVGPFVRVAINYYTPDGRNLSAGYNLMNSSNPIIATFYVYPARRVLSFGSPRSVVQEAHEKLEEMEMESVVREILNAHPGARLVQRETNDIKIGGGYVLPALHARFLYKDVLFGTKRSLVGHVWLTTDGDWYLKYRVTYPLPNEKEALTSLRKLMASLPIPHV